jgi:hypothetical protein
MRSAFVIVRRPEKVCPFTVELVSSKALSGFVASDRASDLASARITAIADASHAIVW